MKTIRSIAILGLLLAGCGSDPAGQPEDDGGTGGAQAIGTGGAAPDGSGGAQAADGGGSGGVMGTGGVVGTGGAGGGGVTGSGGTVGSGGAMGTGGATVTPACAVPAGWTIAPMHQCMKSLPTGGFAGMKKGQNFCATNCQGVQPNGSPGAYVGPPAGAECVTDGTVCVASCGECS